MVENSAGASLQQSSCEDKGVAVIMVLATYEAAAVEEGGMAINACMIGYELE